MQKLDLALVLHTNTLTSYQISSRTDFALPHLNRVSRSKPLPEHSQDQHHPDSLKFDRESKINILDRVVMMKGPDMGKTGVLINLEEGNTAKAIVKFDYDGKAYQEVKMIEYTWLAKAAPDPVSKIVTSESITSNADAN